MPDDFDQVIERRTTDSLKWRAVEADVLPLWVADMDFAAPEPVIRALHARVEHGVLGYGIDPKELREVLVARLTELYGWTPAPGAIVFVPGVVSGFNIACRALAKPGGGILVQTPVYGPILDAPGNASMSRDEMTLTRLADGRYIVDMDRMQAALTGRTAGFLLCNPQNPVGRAFTMSELTAMADLCLRHGLTIISDEIHCDLIFSGSRHIPIASLSPEVEARTITLMAPSKTFNVAGLGCSFAVIPDAELRQQFEAAAKGLMAHVNILAFVATLAAYRDGGSWLAGCLNYLEGNRDWMAQFVRERLPELAMSPLEATYLAWLDCRGADLPEVPAQFFLKQARVALNDGAWFGRGGEGFVRLNFGCPRDTLVTALERIERALRARH